MTTSINLHAMPLNFDEWAKIVAGLTAAQEGTLLRASRVAWQAGHRNAPAATLPNDDAALGRMLGGRDHLDIVRRHFQPSPDDASVLVWPWLSKAYAEALARYQRRKLAGVESGQTRRRRAKEGKPAAAIREHCSNNARAMREQPKPNPVGVVLSEPSPTGGASFAPASGGRATPPDEPSREALSALTPELLTAWQQAHPDAWAALEVAADEAMTHLNPEWRDLPKRFGADVRAQWLREQVARRIGASLAAVLVPTTGDLHA